MEIADLLSTGRVVDRLTASSKKQVLQELAQRAAAATGLHERAIFEVLLERERLGSTAVGKGTAIPHGKMGGLKQIYGLFARLEQPVDFEAIDDQPVDLVFLLLAPEAAGADHLKALARVSRLLRSATRCDKIRRAADAKALHALLTADTATQVA